MKRILLFSFLLMSVLINEVWAQEKTITGTVTSVDGGEGLPGVNVIVPGTTIGTTTDVDGNYRVSVAEGATKLQFSFIGYVSEEVIIGSQSVINITLASDIRQLSEVVITAVGIERDKEALGYSVEEVSSEEILQSREQNIVNALNAKVAGVQVISSSGAAGASSYIKIRGNASLTGGNQPIFIVDGVPISNESPQSEGSTRGVAQANRAADINPNDVESITVLKGPAATALYGLRAANGAVVITTKKGRFGNQKTSVSYNTTYTVDEVNKLPPLQTTYAQGQGGVYQGPGLGSGPSTSYGSLISDLVYDGDPDYLWDNRGRLVLATGPGDSRPRAQGINNTEEFFQTGHTFTNNISVTGGDDKNNFYLSIGRTDQTAIIPETFYEKTSVRLTASRKLLDNLTTTASFNYVRTDRQAAQQGSNTSGVSLALYRTPPSFDNSQGYQFADGTQRSYRGLSGTPLKPAYDNPLWVINKNPYTEQVNRVLSYAEVAYEPLDWLKATYRLGLDTYSEFRRQEFEIGGATNATGKVIDDEYDYLSLNSDLIVSANRGFGDFQLGVIVGQNTFFRDRKNLFTTGTDLAVLDFVHISNAAEVQAGFGQNRYKTSAVYGDITLSWRDMIFLNASGRNEWSSTLIKSVQNNFFYPQVSLSFVFSEALGISNNNIFSYGKIRASYAMVGNDAPIYSTTTPFENTAIFSPAASDGITFPFDGQAGYQIEDVLGNTQLTPETITSYEFGLDLRFFNNRLALDLTYYNSLSEDQILAVPITGSSGFTSIVLNAGEVENKGFEVQLTATPVKVGDFSWDITANFSTNKNEVIALAPGVENISLAGFTSLTSDIVVGYPYGAFFGGDWVRDSDGNKLINDNPSSPSFGYPIVDPESKPIGDPNPDWLAGIRNSFTFKGFTLSGLLDIRKGGDIWNGTRGALITMGVDKATERRGDVIIFDGVLASTVNEDRTNVGEPNNISAPLSESWLRGNGGGFGSQAEQFVEDGSWIRLRDISLSYSLPRSILANLPFQSLEVGITARNLFLITNYSGIDPETNLTGASNGFGLEYFNMPNTKSYGVNLSVRF